MQIDMVGAALAAIRPCLYCSDTKTPKNTEHVLQYGLGGSMTLTEDVCEHCNSVVFAPLDGELVRFIRTLLAETPEARRRILRENLAFTYDESAGVWSLLRLDDHLRPIVCPQIVFKTPAAVSVLFDQMTERDPQNALGRIVEELREPAALSLTEQIAQFDANSPPVQPILARTAQGTYLLVAGSEAELAALRARIMNGRLATGLANLVGSPLVHNATNKPHIRGEVRRDFNAIERAIVKTAINYVCKMAGPEVARSTELGRLRSFARLGGASPGAVRLAYDEPDTRSLEAIFANICSRDQHAIALVPMLDHTAVIQLFGGRVFHVVDLGRVPGLRDRRLVVTTFNPSTCRYDTVDFDQPEHVARAFRLRFASSV